MFSGIVESCIEETPGITDQQIHDFISKQLGAWSTLQSVAECRAKYTHYLAHRTKAQRKWDTRSICKATANGKDPHKYAPSILLDNNNTIAWLCTLCDRVHVRTYGGFMGSTDYKHRPCLTEKLLSMKKSRLFRQQLPKEHND